MPATFHFYLREDRPDKRGLCPVYFRITHNRKRKYINTGIKIEPKHWNADRQEVRKSHRTPDKLNEELDIIRANAEQAYRELNRNKQASADAIKKKMEYASKDNFFALADEYQDEIKTKSYYTWKQNRVAIEKLKKFHGSGHLPLNYIDVAFLTKLVNFMQSNPYNNKASTIHKNFGAIRAVLDRAVLYKLIPKNPMDDEAFSLPKKNGTASKTKLTFQQIQAIEELKLKAGSNLWHARNAFILAYYFCGIRIGDLCMLRWENVKNDRLKYTMSKTGTDIDVKIPEGAKGYLEAYRNDSTDTDFVFPFLSKLSKTQQKNPEIVRRKISSWNTIINGTERKSTGLKKIAELAGIDESISMHVARHSFAQYAIEEKGVPVYRLMILLGHQNIKTTMQYLKTINVKVADETIDAIF